MTIIASRRSFLKGSAAALGAALVVGFDARGALAAGDAGFVANPFVKIGADGSVTVVLKHFEMGQGTTTGLATLVAEELDADWASLRSEWAPSDAATYGNMFMGAQGTGGSTSIANSYLQYRQAGAATRAMFEQAAARIWGVPVETVTIYDGVVKSGDHSASFADLVAEAAAETPPAEPTLKSPERFRYIGNAALQRRDSAEKSNGTAKFAMDVHLPDMLVAVILRSPKFGGKLVSFDDTAARAVPGVVDVKETPRGVAVYAKNTWIAIKGREALTAEWDFTNAETRSSDAMIAEHVAAAAEPGLTAREGDPEAGLKDAAQTVEATFVFPYLAHAPMEPLTCTIAPDGAGGVIVHDGCQFPSITHPTLAAVLGLPPEKIAINTVYAGGSFGRRANLTSDYHAEAAMCFAALGGTRPVKLVWTREDDLAGGYYRPMHVHSIRAGVTSDGAIAGWDHRVAGRAITKGTMFEPMMIHGGIEHFSVEGAADTPYAIANMRVGSIMTDSPISTLWWRSVGHSHTAYAMETMLNRLAAKAGKDAVEFRRALLSGDSDDHRRMLGALNLAAEKSGWGGDLPAGRARGVAVHKSFNSYVAIVAEVSKNADGAVKVETITAAADCGVAVNPRIIEAQLQSAIGYGLGAAMRNAITFADGVVEQANFPDYEPLRLSEMPAIAAYIVPSDAAPSGIGEPGLPPTAPAVAAAIEALTGQPIDRLPFTESGVSFA